MENNLEKWIIGAALAAAAGALLPAAKTVLRPLSTVMETVREEMEDLIAEAQLERMKKQIDRDIELHSDIMNNQLDRGVQPLA